MTCFVCNLPIMSHQVGLVWQGGNGVDDLLREQMEMVSKIIRIIHFFYKGLRLRKGRLFRALTLWALSKLSG